MCVSSARICLCILCIGVLCLECVLCVCVSVCVCVFIGVLCLECEVVCVCVCVYVVLWCVFLCNALHAIDFLQLLCFSSVAFSAPRTYFLVHLIRDWGSFSH